MEERRGGKSNTLADEGARGVTSHAIPDLGLTQIRSHLRIRVHLNT